MKLSDYVAHFISQTTNHVFTGQGSSVVHLLDSFFLGFFFGFLLIFLRESRKNIFKS